jgi:hypothetical protein
MLSASLPPPTTANPATPGAGSQLSRRIARVVELGRVMQRPDEDVPRLGVREDAVRERVANIERFKPARQPCEWHLCTKPDRLRRVAERRAELICIDAGEIEIYLSLTILYSFSHGS